MQDRSAKRDAHAVSAALGVRAEASDGGPVVIDVEQTFDKDFGARVKKARDALEWSQRKLAEELESLGVKLDPSAVTRIERGTREAKLREAAAIAAALGVKLEDLAPPPAASPREQLDAWLTSAGEQAAVARRTLAGMAASYMLALHVIDHHPDLLKTFGVDLKDLGPEEFWASTSRTAMAEAIVQGLRNRTSALLIAADSEQATQLTKIVEAATSNLVEVQGHDQTDT